MPGTKVTATATYCRHTLRAEVMLNAQRDWIGRCVVTGPAFNGGGQPPRPTSDSDGSDRRAIDRGPTVGGWGARRGSTAFTSRGGGERFDGCPRERDSPWRV